MTGRRGESDSRNVTECNCKPRASGAATRKQLAGEDPRPTSPPASILVGLQIFPYIPLAPGLHPHQAVSKPGLSVQFSAVCPGRGPTAVRGARGDDSRGHASRVNESWARCCRPVPLRSPPCRRSHGPSPTLASRDRLVGSVLRPSAAAIHRVAQPLGSSSGGRTRAPSYGPRSTYGGHVDPQAEIWVRGAVTIERTRPDRVFSLDKPLF